MIQLLVLLCKTTYCISVEALRIMTFGEHEIPTGVPMFETTDNEFSLWIFRALCLNILNKIHLLT